VITTLFLSGVAFAVLFVDDGLVEIVHGVYGRFHIGRYRPRGLEYLLVWFLFC